MNNDLALFLGMLCGDGHLSIHVKRRKSGIYYDYYTGFCNTNIKIMELFSGLFLKLFNVRGNFYSRDRPNRKRIYDFNSYSRPVFDTISALGFPIGVKRDKLRIPDVVKNGSDDEKLSFLLGVLITDGGIRKNETIIFHSGSKLFLEDLTQLFKELWDMDKKVKSYIQREKFISYQITLNRQESKKLLEPLSHNGSAPVLSLEINLINKKNM